ncbi:MAG TPA: histidine kinase [Chryseolinea sp.]|nr:histidine kinase [Chryseolinea sp.]HPM28850.1 histidine kinase [Chryseolinea sp.]
MFSHRYRLLFIALLSVYSYLNILFTVGNSFFDFKILSIHLFGVLAAVVLGVWELNRLVEKKIEKLKLKKVHPLLLLFFFSMINVVVVSVVSLSLVYLVSGMPLVFNFTHLKLLLAFGFRINLFLNCLNAIVFFMNRLKKSQLEAEQLKKISIEAQFEALRNQINPHFLFNCFNVLSTLVYKDADTSAKFIGQLSNVYRYLLYNQEKKVVQLREELGFIESYLFLLKIRFGENIEIENKIDRQSEDQYVAPAVLQMLIENAIKHNVVSRKNPLHIKIFSNNGFITVINNLQEKETKEESTQLGLRNIQNRYEFLSEDKVIIEKTENEFKVSIPLLQLAIL